MPIVHSFIIYLLCLCIYPTAIYSNNTLTFSKSNDPVANISEKILQEAYAKVGIKVNTLVLPSERSLQMSNSGRTDGEINRIKGIDNTYLNLRRVPISINILEGVVFSKDLKFELKNWNSLKPYKIGIRRGTKFAEYGTKGMMVRALTNNEQLFQMLDNRRHDIVVTSRLEGLEQIQKLQLNKVLIIEPPLITLKLYHYLHKKHTHLLTRIQSVLEKMRESGRIKTIRQEAIEELINRKIK